MEQSGHPSGEGFTAALPENWKHARNGTASGTSSTFESEPTVMIPDLFTSFLSKEPSLNPYHIEVGADSMEHMRLALNLQPDRFYQLEQRRHDYFAGMLFPDSDKIKLRTVCDFFNWALPFNSMFLYGSRRRNTESARREMNAIIEAITTSESRHEWTPLGDLFRSIWLRCPHEGARQRFGSYAKDYCEAIFRRVQQGIESVVGFEAYLDTRRPTVECYLALPLIEYVYDLAIPDKIFESWQFRAIQTLVKDFLLLHRDVLSYHKEYAAGTHNLNIIQTYRSGGASQQEAYNLVGQELNRLCERWYLTLSAIPIYGEKQDRQIQKYLKGCENLLISHLYWSFATDRFFGNDRGTVRHYRQVRALE
ncbi:hypothetical protein FQN54_004355 [Arachnomyces sp. PD_36]|nr:hypothetical protein FQN54_004355 [Arachnomyces sp. PD_36]